MLTGETPGGLLSDKDILLYVMLFDFMICYDVFYFIFDCSQMKAPGGLLGNKDMVLFMHSAKTTNIFMRTGIDNIYTVNEAICYT